MAAHRYGVYLAPPEPWAGIGARWLGRDAERDAQVPRAADDDPRLHEWTAEPRRYGLHATLKAPFRLAAAATPAGLDHAVRALARSCAPFDAPLRLRALRGFLAWCLGPDDTAHGHMQRLANRVVGELDPLRAALTPQERARRRPERLDAAHLHMLDTWGYPYAMDTFTFHITLTGMLDPGALREAQALLLARGAAVPQPMRVDALAVYVQPRVDAPFVIARHYGFDGSVRDAVGAAYLAAAPGEAP
jgi:hypothetical protein